MANRCTLAGISSTILLRTVPAVPSSTGLKRVLHYMPSHSMRNFFAEQGKGSQAKPERCGRVERAAVGGDLVTGSGDGLTAP